MTDKQIGAPGNRLLRRCLTIRALVGSSIAAIPMFLLFEPRVAVGYALLSALGAAYLVLVAAVLIAVVVTVVKIRRGIAVNAVEQSGKPSWSTYLLGAVSAFGTSYLIRFFDSRLPAGYALLSLIGVAYLATVLGVAVGAVVKVRRARHRHEIQRQT